MKKIFPLLVLVILFATACKKDKDEPIIQNFDGKTIEFTKHWVRDTMEREIFCKATPGSGKVDSLMPFIYTKFDSTLFYENIIKVKISVVDDNLIDVTMEGVESISPHIYGGVYHKTNFTFTSDYYVFVHERRSEYAEFSANSFDINNHIKYVKGDDISDIRFNLSLPLTYNMPYLLLPKKNDLPAFILTDFYLEDLGQSSYSFDPLHIAMFRTPIYFQSGYKTMECFYGWNRSTSYSEGFFKL